MRKEIPILFSTEMVQAILQGRKTMTRRTRGLDKVNENPDGVEFFGFYVFPDGSFRAVFKYRNSIDLVNVKCPYGNLGDLFYVREKYARACISEDGESPIEGTEWRNWYAADTDWTAHEWHNPKKEGPQSSPRWTPSIHMPKDAARIWLEVTDIRVERLQDISENDAKAEGVVAEGDIPASCHFASLWQKINGPESWEANPWTWVVTFKVLSTAGRP